MYPVRLGGGVGSAKPIPEPEHQQRINKSKGFEICAVVVMIFVGVTYFSIRGRTPPEDTPDSLVSLSNVLGVHDFNFLGESTIRGRKFRSYRKQGSVFRSSVDLIANAETDALEAVLIVVAHLGMKHFPPDNVAEPAIQESLDEVTSFSGELIPTSAQALEKAANTMAPGKVGAAHTKGVAQSSDGWKVTYVIYREYEENGTDIPLLFWYQRLSVASDPDLADFNRALYDAINEGIDPKSGLGGA